MLENEITVQPDLSLQELTDLLAKNNFKLKQEYDVHDIYMIKPQDIIYSSNIETSKKTLIIRNVITSEKNVKCLEYKNKLYNDKEEIISQSKNTCNIDSIEDMKKLLETIGYDQLIAIDDHLMVYENETDELCIQVVNKDKIYIEIEPGDKYNNLDDMKNVFTKYNIPIKNSNFFAKKFNDVLDESKNSNLMSSNTDYLNKIIDIKIDRQLGTKHPKHGFYYPVNYGYIPNTISGDGEEIDCYLLGVHDPVESYHGKCIGIIHRTNDDDDKLIICPVDKDYSNDAIEALVEFQEKYFKHILIR